MAGGLQSTCEVSLRPPKVSQRMRDVGERAGMLSSLEGCGKVKEGSGGS